MNTKADISNDIGHSILYKIPPHRRTQMFALVTICFPYTMQTNDLYGVNHKLFGTWWPDKEADTPAAFLCSVVPVNCSYKLGQKCPAPQEGL